LRKEKTGGGEKYTKDWKTSEGRGRASGAMQIGSRKRNEKERGAGG